MSAASPDPSPAAGDRPAQELLERLYAEHFRLVRGICRKFLRDGTEAEDATQQTFLSAYRSLLAGNRPEHAPSWLATIARNECWSRTQARMREPLAVEEPEGSAPGDAFSEAARHEDMAALREALDELPRTQKEAFVLREFAGFSQGEISKALAISESALEALLVRARRRLRERLEPVLQPLYGAFPLALQQLLSRLGSAGGGSVALAKAGSLPLVAKIAATTAGVAALAVGVSSEPRQSPALARAAAASTAGDTRSLEGAGSTGRAVAAAVSTPAEPASFDEPKGSAAATAEPAESEGSAPAESAGDSQGSGQSDSGGSAAAPSHDASGPGHENGSREAGTDDRSAVSDDPKDETEGSGNGAGEGDSGEGGQPDGGEGSGDGAEDPESNGSGETTDGDSSGAGEGSGGNESPATEPPPETPDEPDGGHTLDGS